MTSWPSPESAAAWARADRPWRRSARASARQFLVHQRRQRQRANARAAALKKWRRVTAFSCSTCRSTIHRRLTSSLGQRFVQIQQHIGDDRPRGDFGKFCGSSGRGGWAGHRLGSRSVLAEVGHFLAIQRRAGVRALPASATGPASRKPYAARAGGSSATSRHHPPRQRLRRLDVHRVVQHRQRLQRRVRSRPAGNAKLAARERRSRELTDKGPCAARMCRARGDSGRRRLMVAQRSPL